LAATGLSKLSVIFKRLSPLLVSLIGVKEISVSLEGESLSSLVFIFSIEDLWLSVNSANIFAIYLANSGKFDGGASGSIDKMYRD
jgi:hypothetical protein